MVHCTHLYTLFGASSTVSLSTGLAKTVLGEPLNGNSIEFTDQGLVVITWYFKKKQCCEGQLCHFCAATPLFYLPD